jgi:hypothetical protein
MRFKRTIMICAAAMAGLSAVSTADAQRCQHIGRWTRTADGFVCSGYYTSGECLWYDDCRVNVD